jgi:hypothetical protein
VAVERPSSVVNMKPAVPGGNEAMCSESEKRRVSDIGILLTLAAVFGGPETGSGGDSQKLAIHDECPTGKVHSV